MAEGLCRLPGTADRQILLVDYDRVERHNLLRQNFFACDLGRYKSQALAERLARNYGREVCYSVAPYDRDLIYSEEGGYLNAFRETIIIGCVDNAAARRVIAENLTSSSWWIDSGNGEHSGQVLVGSRLGGSGMEGAFKKGGVVWKLPMPTVQQPALLVPTAEERRAERLDCAEEVALNGQSPVINQAMAGLVLQFVDLLLRGELGWMAAYLDFGAMSLSAVDATPEAVARLLGLRRQFLMG